MIIINYRYIMFLFSISLNPDYFFMSPGYHNAWFLEQYDLARTV